MRRLLRAAAIIAALTAVLAAALEGGTRLWLRWRSGHWPHTFASLLQDGRVRSNRLFQAHPFLNTGPRPGTSVRASGRTMTFNSRGYRSPERALDLASPVPRVVTAGGSTTFDVAVPSDPASWPWRLEDDLRAAGVAAEVWNAGFPGWTSLENVISLALRDLDLQPRLLVLFQGINDLQPAAHQPFDPHYATLHAEISRQAIGIGDAPLPWRARSVFLERALPAARQWLGLAAPPGPPVPPSAALARIPDEAVAVFARNVGSFIALGRAAGARTLLVTQSIHRRERLADVDALIMQQWVPGLAAGDAPRELERFNDVLRRIAASGDADLADAAREVAWSDADFADPMHFTAAGSAKLAAYLEPTVARLLR
jgi:lysophospholipase L1-like esterase